MRPEGGTAHGEPSQEQARLELQPVRRIPWWGRRAGELPPMEDCAGEVLEQCLNDWPCVTQLCLKSCSPWEAHMGTVWEGWEGPMEQGQRVTTPPQSFLSPNMGSSIQSPSRLALQGLDSLLGVIQTFSSGNSS